MYFAYCLFELSNVEPFARFVTEITGSFVDFHFCFSQSWTPHPRLNNWQSSASRGFCLETVFLLITKKALRPPSTSISSQDH